MRDHLLDNRAAESAQRFGALAEVFDPGTFRHLEAIGIGRGWACWDVGAGGPSVPAWLAERTGERVLATDVDVRWSGAPAGVEVVVHDVVDDPPPGTFDLVHVRLVLSHLRQRDVALANVVGALRPGGWLLVEDFDVDFQPCAAPDASSPEQYLANRIRAGFIALLVERGVDVELGRRLPRLLRQHGLVDVGADAFFPLVRHAAAVLDCANVEEVRQHLIGLRVATSEEIDAYIAAALDGTVDVATPPMVSSWGRKP